MLATRMARMGRVEVKYHERSAPQFALQIADFLHYRRIIRRYNALNSFNCKGLG